VAFDSPFPGDEEILSSIRARVHQLLSGRETGCPAPQASAGSSLAA